jgi:hypothetical protein
VKARKNCKREYPIFNHASGVKFQMSKEGISGGLSFKQKYIELLLFEIWDLQFSHFY